MTAIFARHHGDSPLLVSIPHDGRNVPAPIAARFSEEGQALPDTDWHVRKLYSFAKLAGAHLIAAKYSRYVIDLNRPADDAALYKSQVSTNLCPLKTFHGKDIYKPGESITDRQRRERIEQYWQPYHSEIARTLAELKAKFGYALLWDAHSIRSRVPMLFEGQLPDLNIGTNNGKSCPEAVEEAVLAVAAASPFSQVSNDRFTGGFITRHYGDPGGKVFALQLELAQSCYMDEETLHYHERRAASLCRTLKDMLSAFCDSAARIA